MSISKKNNKSELKRIGIIFGGITLILIIIYCCFSLNIVADLYRKDLTEIKCDFFSVLTWDYYGGIIGASRFSFETNSSRKEVVDWYINRGWWCDGACEYQFSIDIGPLNFSMWKILTTQLEDDFSRNVESYSLFEQYGIDLYPISHYWLDN
ncbi:MAG: hypothetical protein K8R16_10510 [Anaerolineales bacterium]|nr:hypothetical protein [Anaerolineales bacterium]